MLSDIPNTSPSSGSLQTQRALAAQDPATFSVEERGSLDWLAVWQALAGKLRFYGLDGQEAGRWSDLLPPPDSWPALAAWIDQGTPLPAALQARAAQPDMALLLAFLRLQRHPRDAFAALTERHRQDYYRRRLALSPKPGQPDEADVLLTLNDDFTAFTLPAGCDFDAGLDDNGAQRLYRSLDALPLTHASLQQTVSLGQSRSPDSASGLSQAQLLRRRCQDAAAGLDWAADGNQVVGETPRATLDSAREQWQTLGVRLASPLLSLSAGRRSVTLVFGAAESLGWTQALRRVGRLADNALPALAVCFNQRWQAQLSLADGSLPLGPAELKWEGQGLAMRWNLEPTAPPISGAAGETPWLDLTLRPDDGGRVLGLDSWQSLQWADLVLRTECDGLPVQAGRNSAGTVDVSAAFDAFPGPVSNGARLWLAHGEWWNKPLTQLKVALDWEGRPASLDSYYQLYKDTVGMPTPAAAVRLVVNPTSGYRDGESRQSILNADTENLSFSLSRDAALGLAPLPDALPPDPKQWPNWFALEWSGGSFGHAEEAQAGSVLAGRYTAALLQWSQQAGSAATLRAESNSVSPPVVIADGNNSRCSWTSDEKAAQQLTLSYDRQVFAAGLALDIGGQAGAFAGTNPQLWASADGINWRKLLDVDAGALANGRAVYALPGQTGYRYYRYQADAAPGQAITLATLALQLTPPPLPQPAFLPPPYTPRLSAVRVGYVSEARLGQDLTLLQYHPIGLLSSPQQAGVSPALPYSPVAGEMGAGSGLYLGIASLATPCVLTLRPDVVSQNSAPPAAPLQWKVLTPTGWLRLQTDKQGQAGDIAAVLSDQSNGLCNSGIVRLRLPKLWQDAQGLSWIAIEQPADNESQAAPPAFSRLLRLDLHAVRVRYVGEDETHLAAPLPARTIVGLVPPRPEISGVAQPAQSQDGHPGEDAAAFAIRAAERLSHKNRALSARDYERLALDAFPKLALARAERDLSGPARVRLIVAPRPDRPGLLQPQPTRKLQNDIAAYMAGRLPPGVAMTISPPRYRVFRCTNILVLNPDYDAGQALQNLNQRLVDFLSPWRRGQGRAVYLSDISHFLSAQPEVKDVVALRSAYQDEQGGWIANYQPWLDTAARLGSLTQADLLVPAEQHLFVQLSDSGQLFEGVGAMEIEFDFEVAFPLPSAPPMPIGAGRIGLDLVLPH
ncbi:baseplate J/gp47 family protein (plasmid) [Chromobacterium amazonense]|uniref:baseplate J/gp47 family protein n=1 Tax=Chromobacterium amazonense TaxID=1382803 RepID=UPI00237E7701|nr:baseplate J/gp47 family protein [Chromobacterium amazonense]MDE1715289.1 baseplate J/gp47 family protein [Chromobacterium amazonense]